MALVSATAPAERGIYGWRRSTLYTVCRSTRKVSAMAPTLMPSRRASATALSRSATAAALSSSMASRAAWAASRRARASLAGVNGVPEFTGLNGVLTGHLDRDDPAVRQFDDEKLGGPVLFLRERACTGTER